MPIPIEDIFAPLSKQDTSPDSKAGVDPLEVLDLPLMHGEPASSAEFFKVTRHGCTSPHFAHLSNPEQAPTEGGRDIVLYWVFFAHVGLP